MNEMNLRHILAAPLLTLALVLSGLVCGLPAAGADTEWPSYGNDPGGMRYLRWAWDPAPAHVAPGGRSPAGWVLSSPNDSTW